jgi:hypothetical protein
MAEIVISKEERDRVKKLVVEAFDSAPKPNFVRGHLRKVFFNQKSFNFNLKSAI